MYNSVQGSAPLYRAARPGTSSWRWWPFGEWLRFLPGKRPAEPGGPGSRRRSPRYPCRSRNARSPASAPVPASSAGGDDGAYAEAEGTPETPGREALQRNLLNVKPGMAAKK